MAPSVELTGERPRTVDAAPLSFALFMVSRALHDYGAELLAQLGLHPGQELILMELFDRDGQTQTQLQRTLGLDHSTVSRSIRRMQDAGLLSRERSINDRRAMVVTLTPAGASMRKPLRRVWATLEKSATASLTPHTIESVVRVSARIETSIRERARPRSVPRPSHR